MTASTAPAAPRARYLHLRKRLAFASPEISITVLYATVNSWYLYYLVNIADLSPALAGLAFAIGRGFDALIDPFIGRWIDGKGGVRGRKRIIVIALAPSALLFFLVWALPAMLEGQGAKLLGACLAYGAFAVAYSLTNVTRLSMLPQYEPDYHGRTEQFAFDMGVLFVTLLVVIAGVPAILTAIDPARELSATEPRSWLLVAGAFAVVACIAYLPFLRLVPDQYSDEKQTAPLFGLFRTPGVAPVLGAFLMSVVSLAAIQSMLPFFLESYVGIPKSGHSVVLGLVFAVSLLTLPLWVMVGRRLGKRRAFLCGLICFGLFIVLIATLPAGSGLSARLMMVAVLAGLSVAALSVFPWAMVPDVADRYSALTGQNGAGLAASTFMLVNQLGASGAVLLNGLFLSAGGHVAGQAQQSPKTIAAIYAAMVVAPTIYALACFGFLVWMRRRAAA